MWRRRVETDRLPRLGGQYIGIDGCVGFVEVGSEAFKIDPDDGTDEVHAGLNGAHTYSDMTGSALSTVAGGIAGWPTLAPEHALLGSGGLAKRRACRPG